MAVHILLPTFFQPFFMKVFFCDFTCNGEIGYSDLKHTKHRCIILHLNAWQFCVGPSTIYIIYMCTTMKIALGKKHEVRLILTWLTRNSLKPNFVPESKVALNQGVILLIPILIFSISSSFWHYRGDSKVKVLCVKGFLIPN